MRKIINCNCVPFASLTYVSKCGITVTIAQPYTKSHTVQCKSRMCLEKKPTPHYLVDEKVMSIQFKLLLVYFQSGQTNQILIKLRLNKFSIHIVTNQYLLFTESCQM